MTGNERTWTAYGSVIDGDELWFVNYRGPLLCCYSLKEKKMKKVEVIPYRGKRSQLLYSNVLKIGSRLILIPANAFHVCFYDVETGTFENRYLNIPADSFNIFCGAAVWKDSVYFFPYHYRYIVKLNLQEKQAECVCDLQEFVRMEPDRAAFQYNYVQKGRAVFFLSAVENKILCFDMDAETVMAKEVGEADAVFSALSLMEDGRFAAIDQKGRIYIISEDLAGWEICDSETEAGLYREMKGSAKPYADCICKGNKVFFFPTDADMLLEYRVDEKAVRRIAIDGEEETDYQEAKWAGNIRFSLLNLWNDWICGFYTKTGKVFLFHPDHDQMEFFEADSYLGETASGQIMKQMLRQGAVNESNHSYDSLEKFLKVLLES